MTELNIEDCAAVNGGVIPVIFAGVSLLEAGATVASVGVGAHMLYEYFTK